MRLCAVADYCSAGVDWTLDQIYYLSSASRPSHVVLSRFWISMAIINDELDDIFQ